MATVKKCANCKEEFLTETLINFKDKKYCPACFKIKQSYDVFSQRICEIFGLKMPGPIINKQRNTLIKNGFTDDTIIKTVEYCYYIKKITRPSLDYINTETVDEMKRYNELKEYKDNITMSAVSSVSYIERCVPRHEEKPKPKKDYEISKCLEDDVF